MKHNFPLKDVIINESVTLPVVEDAAFVDETRRVNGNEFLQRIPGVGTFYVADGNRVEYSVEPGADPEWVALSLNGQVLAALLHQRKILNFHASSFIYKEIGVMISGATRAGKSSVTASFILNNAKLISDDMTVLSFTGGEPVLMPLLREIKIDKNTVSELNLSRDVLIPAEAGTRKFYLNTPDKAKENTSLRVIIHIETVETKEIRFLTPSPSEKFELLRSEICSWEILKGMPHTEKDYLGKILKLIEQVHIVKLVRPGSVKIPVLHNAVAEYLDKTYLLNKALIFKGVKSNNKVIKYFRLKRSERLLFIEALWFQFSSGLLIKVIPFKKLPVYFASVKMGNYASDQFLQQLKIAISRSAPLSPWRNRCLVKALAVRKILNRRQLPSVLSLGVGKTADGRTEAHAWIKSGDTELVGKDRDFTELYTF